MVAAACVATLAFALATLLSRPLDGSEGNFLFDAARIRQGWPLYVDPVQGAWQYGPVPSRYYVLYAPLWAALLALFPPSIAAAVARALALGAWLGLLATIVAGAPRPNRPTAVAGAAFLVGLYPVMLFAASGRPDSVAVALAGVAVFRSLRKGEVGAVEGALFALAPFFKPNVVAAGTAILVADLLARRSRAWPALAGATGCALACAGTLQIASRGAWVEHLVKSSWMPASLTLWTEQMASRLPFFVLPLALSAWCAWRAGSRFGLAALAASAAWTIVSLAKIGSASNYWMEPCVVGLAVVSAHGIPAGPPRLREALSVLALAQVGWTGLAAIRSSAEAITLAPRKAAAIAAVRSRCGAGPDDVVMADETGIEVMLDGRLIEQPLVFTQLAGRGSYPLSTWTEDVNRSSVACLVLQSDWLEPAGDAEEGPFPAAMRGVLRERFGLVWAGDGVWVYRRRRETSPPAPLRPAERGGELNERSVPKLLRRYALLPLSPGGEGAGGEVSSTSTSGRVRARARERGRGRPFEDDDDDEDEYEDDLAVRAATLCARTARRQAGFVFRAPGCPGLPARGFGCRMR
jgi:hypothetical protein